MSGKMLQSSCLAMLATLLGTLRVKLFPWNQVVTPESSRPSEAQDHFTSKLSQEEESIERLFDMFLSSLDGSKSKVPSSIDEAMSHVVSDAIDTILCGCGVAHPNLSAQLNQKALCCQQTLRG
jgi:hypothetical protein